MLKMRHDRFMFWSSIAGGMSMQAAADAAGLGLNSAHSWLRQSLPLHRVLWHGACIWVVKEQSFDLCCMIELIVSTDEM